MQEALAKRADTADLPLRWHLIGPLQSNKANKIPGAFAGVQSVHSLDLARTACPAPPVADGHVLPVLIQVDLAHEATKSGLDEADLRPLLARAPGNCPASASRA